MVLERLRKIIDFPGRTEGTLNLKINPEPSALLKNIVLRPNPELAECAFLCLGTNGVIDTILMADKEKFSLRKGLFFDNGFESSVGEEELHNLFDKLVKSGRLPDLLVIGHLHPSGKKVVRNILINITPDDSLLDPSMGSPKPTDGLDLGFYSELDKWVKTPTPPNVGIAADTREGPKLRIFKTEDLLRIKRYNDIDKVPQITIRL